MKINEVSKVKKYIDNLSKNPLLFSIYFLYSSIEVRSQNYPLLVIKNPYGQFKWHAGKKTKKAPNNRKMKRETEEKEHQGTHPPSSVYI